MSQIINPILRGFNPDPSILRVGEDYFIATSTFEWFPGVQIHHSRDMVHWHLAGRPLDRVSQLDLRGVPNSHGVWAPCLSHDGELFHLIYSNVRNGAGRYLDVHNYLVTAPAVDGPWSEPVYLNSVGFDPSMFHDADGRKWLAGMTCDNAPGRGWFSGIVLQEYCPRQRRLVGPVHEIFPGTALGFTEGPHLYRRDGWYYLMTAEGGTGLDHAVTMARSRCLTGPYEVGPANPILTSRDDPTKPIQKAGHASLVETPDGQAWLAHLCGRPLGRRGLCILGRETCLQPVQWTDDGWLRPTAGGNHPRRVVEAPGLAEHCWPQEPARDDFDGPRLASPWQTLRVPADPSWLSLSERPGWLRLHGRESLNSLFDQSLVARRQQAFCYTATTCLEFLPDNHKQMAGLVCFYNTENYHYLRVTHDGAGRRLGIVVCDNQRVSFPVSHEVALDGLQRVYLRAEIRWDQLQFSWSADDEAWLPLGSPLDAGILSDEHVGSGWGFTGAFVGLCCQDMGSRSCYANFDFFEYTENEED